MSKRSQAMRLLHPGQAAGAGLVFVIRELQQVAGELLHQIEVRRLLEVQVLPDERVHIKAAILDRGRLLE